MANALYELAQNHKIQDKLREEIKQEYAKHGDALTYDSIKGMEYLDKVFKGTTYEKKIKEMIKYTIII